MVVGRYIEGATGFLEKEDRASRLEGEMWYIFFDHEAIEGTG